MSNCVRSFLRQIDLVGYIPQFYINNYPYFSTKITGIISISVWIILIYAFINLSLQVFVTRVPTINDYTIKRKNIPVFELKDNYRFEPFLIFFDNNYESNHPNLDIINLQYYTNHQYFDSTGNTTKLISEKTNVSQFGSCSDNLIKKIQQNFDENVRAMPSTIICPLLDNHIAPRIGGNLLFSNEMFIPNLEIGPKCNNSTCTKTELDLYKEFTNKNITSIVLGISYIIPDQNNKISSSNELSLEIIDLKRKSNKVNFQFTEIKMVTDDGYIPYTNSIYDEKFFTIDDVEYTINSLGEDYESISTRIEFTISDYIIRYDRTFPQIDVIFTGLLSFQWYSLILANVIRGWFNSFNLERHLINNCLVNEWTHDSHRKSFTYLKSHSNLSNESNDIKKNLINSTLTNEGKNEEKLFKIRKLNMEIKKLEIKRSLFDKICISNKSKHLKTHLDNLYDVLDIKRYILMIIQFEKVKQLIINKKQRVIFESFTCDLSILKRKHKNIKEMSEDEILDLIDDISESKLNNNKEILDFIPEEFKKLLVD